MKQRATIENEIIAALETYQWKKTAVMYHFATYLNYSEAYVARCIADLIEADVVEKVADGAQRGKTRFIYRIKKL